jgi:TonB family protein
MLFPKMKSIKQKKHEMISAVCISLLIHFTAGALLIFGLSDNSISPPKLNGINLVWISLNHGSKNIDTEIKNDRVKQQSPAVQKIEKIPANIENQIYKPQASQIAEAVKESINTITLAKYEVSGKGAKEQSYNITGYRDANNTAEKASDSDTVIAYPLYKENAKPAYPEIARARGYEGVVLISAQILPNGRVGEIKIRKSSGYAILDQWAIQAVKPWRFEPAKKSGNPFTAWVELPIKFSLQNSSNS